MELLKYWTPSNFFAYALIANNLMILWDNYLHYRQHRVYKHTKKVPIELASYVDEDNFAKARLYNLDKSNYGFFRSAVSLVQKNILMWIYFQAHLWNWSVQLNKQIFDSQSEIISTMILFFLQSTISTIIDLPFSLYSNFVIEERHGFNKYTLKFFLWDTLKKFLIFTPIMSALVGASAYIVIRFEDQFFLYLWLFSSSVSVILMIVYPSLIAPLFDKYTPLEDGSLRTRIEKLASDIDFPLKNIYVVDGSKRSGHSNAYFYGFFKAKQIVLYDTLFESSAKPKSADSENDASTSDEQKSKEATNENVKVAEDDNDGKKRISKGCTEREIVAITCHELGHWSHNHVFKNLVISLVNMFVVFKLAGMLYKDPVIYEAFGFVGPNKPLLIGLMLVIENIFILYFEVLNFVMSIISRKFEFQADEFAKNLNFRSELISALIKLNKDNLSFPVYDWLYSALMHSHPPILDRINALRK